MIRLLPKCVQRVMAFAIALLLGGISMPPCDASDDLSILQHAPAPKAAVPLREYLKQHALTVELVGNDRSTSQATMVLTDPHTGKQTSTPVNLVCGSTMHRKPPAAPATLAGHPVHYKLVRKADESIIRILRASKELEKKHAYNSLPIPESRRPVTIAQLAIWKERGLQSANADDRINEASVRNDLLQNGNIDVKSLTRAERQILDRRVTTS